MTLTVAAPVTPGGIVVAPPVTLLTVLYSGGAGGVTVEQVDAKIAAHVNDTQPHPVYDDLPSLTLLFENGLA